MTDPLLAKMVKQANIEFHSSMASSYNADQPHYRLENVKRVEKAIRDLAAKTGGGVLLDIGCGTGFIIDIAKRYFGRVVGIDLTQAMLDQVVQAPNVEVCIGDSDNLQFEAESFDVCTAYSFLHHLPALGPTLREVYRVLKPNGCFYSDQDPNWYLFSEVYQSVDGVEAMSELMKAEISAICKVAEVCQEKYNVDPETVVLAEFQKLGKQGIKPNDLSRLLLEIGFTTAADRLEWFIGQGQIMHGVSSEATAMIDHYLRTMLPVSRCLFKYFSLVARK